MEPTKLMSNMDINSIVLYVFVAFIIIIALWFYKQINAGTRALQAELHSAEQEIDKIIADSAVARPHKINIDQLPNILQRKPDLSHYRPMCATITSIGVLGTFMGIAIGLFGIDMGAGGDELMQSIQQLLSGMSVAFITSVLGIFCSLLLSFCIGSRESALKEQWKKHTIKADTYFKMPGISDLIIAMDIDKQQLAVAQQIKAAEQMAEAGQGIAMASQSFNAERIGTMVAEELHKILSGQMVPLFSEIRDDLRQLREIKQDNGEKVINAIMNELRSEVIAPLSEGINETAALVRRSAESTEDLATILRPLSSELSVTVSSLQAHQKETLAAIGDVLSHFRENIGEQIARMLETSGNKLEDILGKLDLELGQHLKTLDKLATTMPVIDETYMVRVETIISELIQAGDLMSKQQMQMYEEVITGIKRYHEESAQHLTQYFVQLDAKSAAVAGHLLDVMEKYTQKAS